VRGWNIYACTTPVAVKQNQGGGRNVRTVSKERKTRDGAGNSLELCLCYEGAIGVHEELSQDGEFFHINDDFNKLIPCYTAKYKEKIEDKQPEGMLGSRRE
jgi:hypothetical protein